MNNDKHTIETQAKIIDSLRNKVTERDNQIDQLNEQIASYEDLVNSQQLQISGLNHQLEDWFKFKAAMGTDLRIPVVEVYNRIATVRNREVELEGNRINAERAAEREATAAELRKAEEDALLKDNPNLLNYRNQQKQQAKDVKDRMTDLVNRFYDMHQNQLRDYTNVAKHKPEESAVKYLLQTTEDKDQTIYECLHCGDESYNLSEYETHCYLNEDHKDAALSRIDNEARESILKADQELQKDINDAIKGKAAAAAKREADKQRAYEAKLKKTLPFDKGAIKSSQPIEVTHSNTKLSQINAIKEKELTS